MKKATEILPVVKRRKGWFIGLGIFIILIVGLRIALPHILLKVVNQKLTMIDDYNGHVGDLDLFLIRAYKIQDIELNKKSGEIPVPFFSADAIHLSVEWKSLFKGAIVGEIEVEHPVLNYVKGPTEATSQTNIDKDWTQVVDELMPLSINRLEISDGEIHYQDFYSSPQVDIFTTNVHVVAENLNNTNRDKEALPANAIASASVYGGEVSASMKLNPLNMTPTFDMNAELKSLNLVELNDFLKAYGNFDVEKGTISVYAEAAAKDSAITGYVKPLLTDLDVVQWKREDQKFGMKVWESIVEAAGWIFKNHPEDQVGTKVEFQGKIDGPKVDVLGLIWQTLRNAFIQALYPSLENSINISNVAKKNQPESKLEKDYNEITETEENNKLAKRKQKGKDSK